MNWSGVFDTLLGQLGALIAFFAFPVIQYAVLRHIARDEGKPELWYLPKYGFRLVIRNLPRRRALSNIQCRALVRTLVPPDIGCSAGTFVDAPLHEEENFFLFPGNDQVLVCFRLEVMAGDRVCLIYTDKLGEEKARFVVGENSRLVADFTGTLQNLFNFNVQLARRIEIFGERLLEIAHQVLRDNKEQSFAVSRVREVS